MAIFTKDENEKNEARAAATDNALSVIAVGMVIIGDVECTGVVKIEGRIEGAIRRARQVLIGRQGSVKGDIEAREVVIGGRVDGTITGHDRVDIQGSASVHGDIHTKTIVVQEGGRINGTVHMQDAAAAPNAAPATNGATQAPPRGLTPRRGAPTVKVG